jgi:plastocyanin
MRKIGILMVLLSVGLLMSACGGDDESGSSSATTAAPEAPPVSLTGVVNIHGTANASNKMEVELDDFYFGPTFIKAKAGEKFDVELSNDGKATHTFTIDSLSVDQQFAPGEKKTVSITAPGSGKLEFYCRFHKGRGMQGAVFVG